MLFRECAPVLPTGPATKRTQAEGSGLASAVDCSLSPLAQSVAGVAESPAGRGSLDWFRRERNWINQQHLKLCRIPAPTFFEEKRAAWMAEQFKALGWDARRDRR